MLSSQPGYEEHGNRARRLSSSEDLTDILSQDNISDRSSNASFPTGSRVRATNSDGHDEQSSVASTSKKPPKSRPNKHHGAGSTWRSRTASERQLAASLDQLRAKDLSIHLYNFYALKRQLHQEGQKTHISSLGKDWASSKSWTAWPMTPELVPRESDLNSWEDGAGQEAAIKFDMMSSHETVQELLAAQAAKEAKERFSKRDWEDADTEANSPPNARGSQNQARIIELVDDSINAEEDEPVVLADDQLAKAILQPSLNHVLMKLDPVLVGLHHARSSYSSTSKSSLRLHKMVDDESSMDNKQKRKAISSDRSQKRKSRRKGPSARPEDLSSADEEPISARGRRSGSDHQGVKQPSRSRSTFDRRGLRDWSDVLGVASMCGWDPGVVARAAARCSNLFDEGMVFRTLHEGQDGYDDSEFAPKTSTTEVLEGSESMGKQGSNAQTPFHQGHNPNEEENDARIGGVHVDGFLRPIPKHTSWTRKRKQRKR
ncbi:MAG: hypothetical protein Q9188_007020 [Gyalolechia gomerana]